MRVWTKYYEDVLDRESGSGTGQRSSKAKVVVAKQKETVDIETFVKMVSTWVVGGFVSLLPVFTSLLRGHGWEATQTAIQEVFRSQEFFLVITTLTITCLCEMVYDANRSGIKKKLLILAEIMLITFSLHLYTLMQADALSMWHSTIGVITLAVCLLICLVGYYVISKKRG